MNICCFAGNLGADPELRMGNGGTAVLKMRLAVNERRKNGEQWEDFVEWIPVVVFGKRAEGLAKFLTKGAPVCVNGKFRTRSYEDKDGNKRYSTEIVADDVKPMGKGGAGGGGSARGGSRNFDEPGKPEADFGDDDIPFIYQGF